MGVYDQGARYAIKRDPVGFFQWLTPRFAAAFAFRRWADTSTLAFPGEPDRVCDTVGEFAAADGRSWLLDVEVQTEPDPDMLERLGEYVCRLRRELRPAGGKFLVAPVLLGLTGSMPPLLDMTAAELADTGMRLLILQRSLRDEDAATTLADIEAGRQGRCLLPWVPLMRGADQPAIMVQWRTLAEQEPDAARRSDYGGLALVFVELTAHAAAWRQALEGWNVKQSPQVLEWQAQARREGRVEGQAEGRLEGRAEGKVEAVLRVLELRFGSPVANDLVALLNQVHDPMELSRWLDAALTAPSLDAFRHTVGPPTRNGA